MFDKIVTGFLFLLQAKSWAEYVVKLCALCSIITVIAALFRISFGITDINALVVASASSFLVTVPIFILGARGVQRLQTLQDELARMASTDLLTGLANRRAFLSEIEQIDGGVLVMLDVDHFKRINDTFGHTVGDKVLSAIAQNLKDVVGHDGLVSRFGGEEFAIFVPGSSTEGAEKIAQRIADGFRIKAEYTYLKVTLSGGIAEARTSACYETALSRADAALYIAKKAGRAQYKLWSPKLQPLATA